MSKITDFIIWLEENWSGTEAGDNAIKEYVEFVLRESLEETEDKE